MSRHEAEDRPWHLAKYANQIIHSSGNRRLRINKEGGKNMFNDFSFVLIVIAFDTDVIVL